MKIIKNNIIPFDGYIAMTVWPFIFVRKDINKTVLNHEEIHGKQQLEMLILPFFIWYIVEWIIRLFCKGNAYRNISFEREAFQNEKYPLYLDDRKHYAWLKYMFND